MAEYTIAIVEDEEELRENLQDLLEFKGYAVVAFENAEAMLSEIESIAADLVLLDFQLPGMTGLEALPKIKEKKPELPAAMVTASCQQETIDAATSSGADRVIFKPYTPDEMLLAVAEMLG